MLAIFCNPGRQNRVGSMQVRSALASKVSKERVGTELRSMIRGDAELMLA